MRSKLVKVFIASSAELDQDKTMFDVYFSDKNKLYRKKDIEFDHRTWKDFCSSLNDGRLQDRYNAYIRECDLVIFLFHTRLGKYTREELEVALAAFRENKDVRKSSFILRKKVLRMRRLPISSNTVSIHWDTSAMCTLHRKTGGLNLTVSWLYWSRKE